MKLSSAFFANVAKTALCIATCFSTSASFATPINTIENPGFEAPSSGLGYYGYTYRSGTTVDGWTYAGNSGTAANNSAFSVSNAPGYQAAFLQTGNSVISQAFNFSGGYFSIDFLAESRIGYGGNIINVFVDNQQLSFNGSGAVLSPTSYSFTLFSSDLIGLSAGQHVLTFKGTATSDRTTFIDSVNITEVPEPGSLALLAIGTLGAAGIGRRRRS